MFLLEVYGCYETASRRRASAYRRRLACIPPAPRRRRLVIGEPEARTRAIMSLSAQSFCVRGVRRYKWQKNNNFSQTSLRLMKTSFFGARVNLRFTD